MVLAVSQCNRLHPWRCGDSLAAHDPNRRHEREGRQERARWRPSAMSRVKRGVSVASASRALNDHQNVAADTRDRVDAAARRLRYVPHEGARSLTRRRSDAIGVVLPDLFGEYFSELVRGIDRVAHANGLQLLLSNMHGSPHETAQRDPGDARPRRRLAGDAPRRRWQLLARCAPARPAGGAAQLTTNPRRRRRCRRSTITAARRQ